MRKIVMFTILMREIENKKEADKKEEREADNAMRVNTTTTKK